MFLYYLIKLTESDTDLEIQYVYFSQKFKYTKEELIKLVNGKLDAHYDYGKVPIHQIYGIREICTPDANEKYMYFFYLGAYHFYYVISSTYTEALKILDDRLDNNTIDTPTLEYDSISLDQIEKADLCASFMHDILF